MNAHEIIPVMDDLREAVDDMEIIVERGFWPVPTYNDSLLRVRRSPSCDAHAGAARASSSPVCDDSVGARARRRGAGESERESGFAIGGAASSIGGYEE